MSSARVPRAQLHFPEHELSSECWGSRCSGMKGTCRPVLLESVVGREGSTKDPAPLSGKVVGQETCLRHVVTSLLV